MILKFSQLCVKPLLILVIVFKIISHSAFSQNNNLLKFHGTVLQSVDYSPIANTNIININSGFVTISDEKGKFEILYSKGDSLKISAVGFETQYYIVNQKITDSLLFDFIIMKAIVYNLPEVKIFPYKDYTEFKKAFIELNVKDQLTVDLHLPKDLQVLSTTGNGAISLGSPITALYNLLSKKGRAYMHYLDVIEHEDYNRQIEKKYNVLIVKNITGLTDDEETVKFMQFCKLSEEFVYKSKEYELYKAILDCYDSYLCEKVENLK